MKKSLLLAGAALSCTGFSQTYSSFVESSAMSGLTVSPSLGLSFTLSLANSSSITIGGNSYSIAQVFGVFALNGNGDINATAGTAPSGWSFVNHNSGPGGIAGYEGNSNNVRINPGQSGAFTFNSLEVGKITGTGFHILLGNGNNPLCGQTLYVKAPQSVPEPTTLAGIGIASLAFFRRKRTR